MNSHSYEDRLAAFHESYGNDEDPGQTLADIVIALGNSLEMILGEKIASKAMTVIAETLGNNDGDWREKIESGSSSAFSEWPLGQRMHDLVAYAKFGIDVPASADDSDDEIAERIEGRIIAAEKFLAGIDLDLLIGKDRRQDLEDIVVMARTRWQLDQGKHVAPDGLARLGGVSDSRMRGLARNATDAVIPMDDLRLVSAQAALDWLANQPKYRTSIWRTERPSAHEPDAHFEAVISDPIFVPESKDGSRFLPELAAGNGFRIGQKGHEQVVKDFDEALTILSHMERPTWRRPSPTSGIPSIVSGVRWVRVDRNSLNT